MKSLVSFFKYIVFGSFILFASCTGNDILDDEINGTKNEISGIVHLENGNSKSKCFVFITGYNIGVFTQTDGSFKLNLPLNENFKGIKNHTVYFYSSFYEVDSLKIQTLDGVFQYNADVFETNGELKNSIYLEKQLITTFSVSNNESKDNLVIDCFIQAYSNGQLFIPLTKISSRYSPIAEMQNIFITDDSYNIIAKINMPVVSWGQFVYDNLVSADTLKILIGDYFKVNNIPKGNYKIIPQFYSNTDKVPVQLFQKLQKNVFSMDDDYFNIPLADNQVNFNND